MQPGALEALALVWYPAQEVQTPEYTAHTVEWRCREQCTTGTVTVKYKLAYLNALVALPCPTRRTASRASSAAG
jgi:hypothetical protein